MRAQLLDPRSVERHKRLDGFWQAPIKVGGNRIRGADQPRRKQCCGGGDGYRNRVEKWAGGARRKTDRGDNERELSDLSEAHAGLDRSTNALTSEKNAGRDPNKLTDNDEGNEDEDHGPMVGYQSRVNEHTDRNEEDRREHVSDGLDEMFDYLRFTGFCNQSAGEEGSKRYRVPDGVGNECEGEAQTDTRDDSSFWSVEPNNRTRKTGNNEQSATNDQCEKCSELADCDSETPSSQTRTARDGSKDGEKKNSDKVLDDEDAEDDLGEFTSHILLGKRFDEDGCARDGDEGTCVQALKDCPTKQLSGEVSEPNHQATFDHCDETGRRSDTEEFR